MKGSIIHGIVTGLAIVSITVMGIYALHKDVNGKVLVLVMMCVAGLGGFHVAKLKEAVKALLK